MFNSPHSALCKQRALEFRRGEIFPHREKSDCILATPGNVRQTRGNTRQRRLYFYIQRGRGVWSNVTTSLYLQYWWGLGWREISLKCWWSPNLFEHFTDKAQDPKSVYISPSCSPSNPNSLSTFFNFVSVTLNKVRTPLFLWCMRSV